MMGCISRESNSPKYQSHACKWGRWRFYSPLIGFIGTFINRIIKDKTKISFFIQNYGFASNKDEMQRESLQFKVSGKHAQVSFLRLSGCGMGTNISGLSQNFPLRKAFHQIFILQPIIDQLSSFLSPYNFPRRFLWWLRW